ncbi:hypothetical protein PMAYCL1PPCAC_04707, partial [Pristionchus mayeri]
SRFMMDLHRVGAELEKAFEHASNIMQDYEKSRGRTVEDALFMNMCEIIMDSIDSIETNTSVSPTNFNRARYDFSLDPSSRYCQLGYSLTVLIDRLMGDRLLTHEDTIPQKERSDPATSPLVFDHSSATTDSSMEFIVKEELFEIEDEPTSGESPSGSSFVLLDDVEGSIEVKEGPEIKMEDPEIKVEEPDIIQEINEIKQEPIADIFLPNTGDSRPVGQQGVSFSDMQLGETVDQLPGCSTNKAKDLVSCRVKKCFMCGELTDKFTCVPPIAGPRKTVLDQIVFTTPIEVKKYAELVRSNYAVVVCNTHMNQKTWKRAQERKCHVCGKITDTYKCVPSDYAKREEIVNKMEAKTNKEFLILEDMKINNWPVFICGGHWSKESMSKQAEEERLKKVLTIPANFKPKYNRQTIAALNIPPPVQRIRPKQCFKCSLCGEISFPNTASPEDPIEARKFFDKLVRASTCIIIYSINYITTFKTDFCLCPVPRITRCTKWHHNCNLIFELTAHEKEKIEILIANKTRADICQKHFNLHIVEGEKNPICSLCDEIADPYMFSPKPPQMARQFFHNLTELTLKQRRKVRDLLAQKERQWIICARHFTPTPGEDCPGVIRHQVTYAPIVTRPVVTNKGVVEIQVPDVVVKTGSSKRKQTFTESSKIPARKKIHVLGNHRWVACKEATAAAKMGGTV